METVAAVLLNGDSSHREEQHDAFVLPSILYGIFCIEPGAVEHFIDVSVRPIFYIFKLCLDNAHLVEDKEHM